MTSANVAAEDVTVWLDDGGSLRVAGTLRPSFAGGRSLASSSFQYDASYLAQPDAFEISPDLRLTSTRHYAPQNTVLFGAFADAAPDQWGRKIIEAGAAARRRKQQGVSVRLGDFDFLTGVSDRTRMGALRFQKPGTGTWMAPDTEVADVDDLSRILAVARRYEDDEASDEDLEYLLDIATSPGGARPKANVELPNGRLAIVKLPHSKDGRFDVEAWEAVALTLAHRAGIRVPIFHHERASASKSVLLLERFDRGADGSRHAYLSAASMLSLGCHDDARLTYTDFADVLAEMTAVPGDLVELFRRIALTVLVNNVDDHWRNHGVVRGERGWRLSPVFDVNPVPRRGSINSRPICDEDDPRERDIMSLYHSAGAFGLTSARAAQTLNQVADAVGAWRDVAQSFSIPVPEQDAMAPAFSSEQVDRIRALPV